VASEAAGAEVEAVVLLLAVLPRPLLSL